MLLIHRPLDIWLCYDTHLGLPLLHALSELVNVFRYVVIENVD